MKGHAHRQNRTCSRTLADAQPAACADIEDDSNRFTSSVFGSAIEMKNAQCNCSECPAADV